MALLKRFTTSAIVVLALALAISPLAVSAQDLSQTFTTGDGTVTFQYPGDWVAQEFFGTVLLGSSQTAADLFFEGDDLSSGQAVVAMLTPASVVENLGMSGDAAASPEDLLSLFIGDMESSTSGIETLSLGGRPAARTTGEDMGEALVAFAVDFGEGGMALIVQVTLPGEEGDFEGTTRAIIETMQASKLAEPVETGTVVWQQLNQIDSEAEFGQDVTTIEKVVVGPDDTIYVLDAFAGVYVFDADGNAQGRIMNQITFGSMSAMALAADGTLWTVDYMGTFTQFDTTGTTLSSFELGETAELAYFGVDLAAGPDGNLYMLNPREVDEGAVGEVLVFSTAGELLRRFDIGTDDYFYEASLTFGPDGNLYVAEYFGESGVKVFDSEGNLLRQGIGSSQLYTMSSIAVAPDGSIFVTVPDSPIYHFASDGTLLGRFGQSQFMVDEIDFTAETLPPMGEGIFYQIGGVGVLSNGDIVVGDTNEDWWQLTRINFAE